MAHALLKESGRPPSELPQVLTDFCFIVALAGNDYMPAVQFGRFETLWPTYCALGNLSLIDLKDAVLRVDQFRRFTRHLHDSAPPDYFGVQQKLMASARENPATTRNRITKYLRGTTSVTRQFTGRTIDPTITIDYPYQDAPSIGEFAEFLDDTMQADLMPAVIDHDDPPLRMHPGTAAIMMLPPTEESRSFLPLPLQTIANALAHLPQQRIHDQRAIIRWLNQQIDTLDRTSLTKDDIDTIFERPPTTISGTSRIPNAGQRQNRIPRHHQSNSNIINVLL
jgi:hypothetical protein